MVEGAAAFAEPYSILAKETARVLWGNSMSTLFEQEQDPSAPTTLENASADTKILDEPIRIEGNISPKDLKIVAAATQHHRYWASVVFAFFIVAPLVIAATCFRDAYSMYVSFAVYFGVVAVAWPTLYAIRWYRDRSVKDRFETASHQKMVISEHGIETATNSSSETESWAAYSDYLLCEKGALLFFPPGDSYRLVPRSFFENESDWETFLRLLERELPGHKG
jgi:hypothetical protein